MRTIRIVNNICAFEMASTVTPSEKSSCLSFTRPSFAIVFAVALLSTGSTTVVTRKADRYCVA